MTPSTSIRTQLRTARKARKLTQEAVAIACGVNRFSFGKWETGKHSPTWEQLDRWALAVGWEAPTT